MSTAPVFSIESEASGFIHGVSQRLESPAVASDPCGSDWERALVTTIRQKGFLSRTERAYRDWGLRFVRFIAPRSIEMANEVDVGDFLSALAVQHRASRSAQKQALNAVVFLLREALKQPLREIAFERAAPCRKVTTVLTC